MSARGRLDQLLMKAASEQKPLPSVLLPLAPDLSGQECVEVPRRSAFEVLALAIAVQGGLLRECINLDR